MKVDIRIREAREGDAASLAAAERLIAQVPGKLASRPDEIDDDAIRKLVAQCQGGERGLFLVAMAHSLDSDPQTETAVGHAFLEPLGLAVTAHVVRLTLAVHEGHQRQGIGRALMDELLAWARKNLRVEKVELQVRSTNEAAIALYRRLGFVEEGRKTRRLKVGPGAYIDDLYMALWVGV